MADVKQAMQWLKAAIDLHAKHMNGTAPTTGPDGNKSQQLMMDQMQKAYAFLSGDSVMESAENAGRPHMAKRLHNFTEETYQSGRPTIDRTEGVIRGVKILGPGSRNDGSRRVYSQQALKEAAAIYEGIGVNTNHPGRSTPNASRGVEEGLGWLSNVSVKEDGVYGDLNVFKAHPFAETVFEMAERKPDRFGLSHNAAGDVVERAGKRIVESIKSVRSVDLVQNPATVNSLFESEAPVADRKLSDVLEEMEAGKEKSHLLKLLEMDGSPMTADMPVPELATEGGESDPYAEVIEAGVLAVWRDKTLDNAGKLAKIKALFGLADKMAEPTADGAPEPEGEKDVAESLEKRLAAAEAELQEARDEKACRALLESKQLEVTDKRLNLLKSVKPTTRTDLIEEWVATPKAKPPVQRPQRSAPAPLLESDDGRGKPAKGAKEMISRYR